MSNTTIIKNASELLNRTKKMSECSKRFLKLNVGEGFVTVKGKVPGLRVLASQHGMGLAARKQPNGTVLVCHVTRKGKKK